MFYPQCNVFGRNQPASGMVSPCEGIWTLCRGRKDGDQFLSLSWPDDTCSDACPLLSGTIQALCHSDKKIKNQI